jgi:hypothetical protein
MCTVASINPGFLQQIMPYLTTFMPQWQFGNSRSFTSTRLKHLTFCVSGFTLFIGSTVLLSTLFCYTLNTEIGSNMLGGPTSVLQSFVETHVTSGFV